MKSGRAQLARSWGATCVVAALAGCAPSAPTCDDVCGVARPAFEECLDTWGMTYGDAVGYVDGEDYDVWCETWVMEQRLLARTASEPEEASAHLEMRCETQIETLTSGDCGAYWGLWD